MKKILLLIFIAIIASVDVFATHNRAGEITYQWISGNTYKIRVTTYTRSASTSADRCQLTIYCGDGDSAVAPRINFDPTIAKNCGNGIGNGVSLPNDIQENIYETYHTFPGSGVYIITMEDPNRNEGICNIPNSVQASFFLRTELVINPFLGPNSSPELLNKPIDNACVGKCFKHNPGAFDVDGDSLSYTLTTCYANGVAIFGYTLPPNMSLDDINAQKGDVKWCSPPSSCQGNGTPWAVNIAILIKEYRLMPGTGKRYYIGSVLRDMQITVADCANHPPVIKPVNDTCIVAGSNLNFNVSATDPDGDWVTLTATGGPLQISPKATFTSFSAFGSSTGTFSWSPNCSQVQLLPYLVTFKATDSNTPALVDYKSVFIRVIAPGPTGLTATPSGASITINWNAEQCNDTVGSNRFLGYYIYRKNSCDPYIHDKCETGVSASSGYTFIGSTERYITKFTDNNNGQGLVSGINYSYIVVAYYSDGSQSYASVNVCAKLKRDVPIITNVSVISTGTKDSVWTHWIKPKATGNNLDTIANPPPYEYRLMRASGFNPAGSTFTKVAGYNYSTFYSLTDTGYVSTNLNTQDSAYTYRVDFYSNGKLVGSTNTASSIYLSSANTDHEIDLSWAEVVPWFNYRYYVYRETAPGTNLFVLLDSTVTPTYADTGLVNRKQYCYKIVSYGKYSDTTLPRPLINKSQIKCDAAVDRIPPCQPKLTVSNDCDAVKNTLTWLNPNTYCCKDGLKYRIYFGNTTSSPLLLIDSVNDINSTTYLSQFLYEGTPSVAGCYAVTAIDSTGNESPIVFKECVDNCPLHELPNVFSPNGDGINDFFRPLSPYRYVIDVSIEIYNRWGTLMFKTTDPDIMWDGKNYSNKKPCTDGTYFYICTFNEIRVEGITPHISKGFIELSNEGNLSK